MLRENVSSNIKIILAIVVGVALLGLVLWCGYALLSLVAGAMGKLDPNAAAGVIAAVGIVVVMVVYTIVSRHSERRGRLAEAAREKKARAYEGLIKFTLRHVVAADAGSREDRRKVIAGSGNLMHRIVVWGSDDVLAALAEIRRAAASSSDAGELLWLYERLIRAIRRDLGHTGIDLGRDDVRTLIGPRREGLG